MTDCTNIARWVQCNKRTELDGTEREGAQRDAYNLSADELEALGHEALRVAAEWRKEIAERVSTPPAHKVFAFSHYGSDTKIATWVEHPWALVHIGKGTAVVFLVKEQNAFGSYQAWIVAGEKDVNGRLRWKRRFETPTTVNQRDLVHVFQCALPYSPSRGDLEYARLRQGKRDRHQSELLVSSILSDAEYAEFGLSRTDKFGQPGPHRGNRTVDLIINARDTRMLRSRPKCPSSRQVARIEPSWRQINRRAFRVPRKCGAILLEPISKLPTAVDPI
jgi:hypothetical protein